MAANSLLVSHYIYLTRDQRYYLNRVGAEIEVVGSCSLAWSQTTPVPGTLDIQQEIFAKYQIKHCLEAEKHTISFAPEGFSVKLSPEMPNHLFDVEDRGSCCLLLTHKNYIDHEGEKYMVIHYMNIESIEILEKTLI